MMALPCSARRRIRACSLSVSTRPSAAVGSSIMSRDDSMKMALAISTSCCSATESCLTTASGSMLIDSSLRTRRVSRRIVSQSTTPEPARLGICGPKKCSRRPTRSEPGRTPDRWLPRRDLWPQAGGERLPAFRREISVRSPANALRRSIWPESISRSVFPDQSVNLPRRQNERDILQRLNAREGFADIACFPYRASLMVHCLVSDTHWTLRPGWRSRAGAEGCLVTSPDEAQAYSLDGLG